MGFYSFNTTKADNLPPPLDPAVLRAKLPKVGDKFRKTPTLCIPDHKPAPAMCEVVYVNYAHLWYTVEFKVRGSRFRESYKLPELKG